MAKNEKTNNGEYFIMELWAEEKLKFKLQNLNIHTKETVENAMKVIIVEMNVGDYIDANGKQSIEIDENKLIEIS